MKKSKQTTLIATILVAAVIISGSLVFLGTQLSNSGGASILDSDIESGIEAYVAKQQAKANKPQVVSGDYSDDDAFMGDEDAPVTMIEFSDFECPYCKRFYNDTLGKIIEKYVDTGKVKLVYRDYPLDFHPVAFPAALASECAREQGGDEVFFAMHDKIFGAEELVEENLSVYARELGLDMNGFNECVESEKYKDEIYADLADGQKAGITGTPGFIINGQLVSGAQPFSVFESIIEAELAK